VKRYGSKYAFQSCKFGKYLCCDGGHVGGIGLGDYTRADRKIVQEWELFSIVEKGIVRNEQEDVPEIVEQAHTWTKVGMAVAGFGLSMLVPGSGQLMKLFTSYI